MLRPPLFCALLAASLAGAPAHAAPGILLAPALSTERSVTLSGRVLRECPSRGSSALSGNLRELLASGLPGARVRLEFGGAVAEVSSRGDGSFSAELSPPQGRGFTPGLSTARAQVEGTVASAPVTVLSEGAPFIVVSDVDDTVVVTHVRRRLQLARAALFQDGLSQPAVPGMAGLYRCLMQGKAERPGLVFLSGTPLGFAPRLRTFLLRGGFPVAALVLRASLSVPLAAHKREALEQIAAQQRAPLLLVGDSGERDPEIYAAFRAAHPERVLGIFIRDAGGELGPDRLEGMVLFREAAELARGAAARGWLDQDCAASEVVGAVP